jgi:hypothetical protein
MSGGPNGQCAMTLDERKRHYREVIDPPLRDLAHRMVVASGMEDDVLQATVYQELKDFYDEQVASGHWHPYLTESIGDFTDDAEISLEYYERALTEARLLNEPTHTILIFMARRLLELGQLERARICLEEGRAEAVRRADDDYVQEADELLPKYDRLKAVVCWRN